MSKIVQCCVMCRFDNLRCWWGSLFHISHRTTPGLYQGSRSRDEFIMCRRACISDVTRMLTTPGIQQDSLEGFVLILRYKSHQRGIRGQKILLCFGIWKCLDQQESFSHITSVTQRNRLSRHENSSCNCSLILLLFQTHILTFSRMFILFFSIKQKWQGQWSMKRLQKQNMKASSI